MSQETLTKIINSKQLLEVPPELYHELQNLARYALKSGQKNATLDTNAVVHEAVIKIYEKQALKFQSRGHFYALMAQIMRHTVIDYARKKQSLKQGGDYEQINMTQIEESHNPNNSSAEMGLDQILLMDQAMQKLAELDAELEQLVVMRFYGGLGIAELATSFECSESSIKRNLRTARAFLKTQML